MFGRRAELYPMRGKSPSAKTRELSRIAQKTSIFVFSLDGTLTSKFFSAREAGLIFNCLHIIIVRYVRNKKMF